jgi:hypothetical protein
MREAGRHKELVKPNVIEVEGLPFAEGPRRPTNVDYDVPDGAARHAHELRLSRGGLVMQPAYRSYLRARMVVLNEVGVDADRLVGRASIRLDEKSPFVALRGWLNLNVARQPLRQFLLR